MKYHQRSKACRHSMKLYVRKCRDWHWEWNECDRSVPVRWKRRHKSKTLFSGHYLRRVYLRRVSGRQRNNKGRRAAAEEAKRASERALAQAALLKEEQAKSAQQLSQVFAAQSESAQQNIQQATQVAVQTQREVKDLTFRAQKAEYAAQVATAKMEQQLQEMTQQVEQQKLQAVQEAQLTKEKQEKLAQQLAEAQQTAQSSALLSQEYEKRFSALSAKMGQMETLLVTQKQKSSQLESQLSAAQDRIGGAERRAKLLETENTRIQGEIQYWNELYSQETGTIPPSHVSSASVSISLPAEGSMISSPPAESNVTADIPNVPLGSFMPQDQMVSFPLMSSPSLITGFGQNEEVTSSSQFLGTPFFTNAGMHFGSSFVLGSDGPQVNRGVGSSFALPQESNERRASFGSTFPGSSGTGGNGNGTSGSIEVPRTQVHPGSAATFNIGIKPKDPPVFHGRANEDVDTWLAKVGDFLYLTEANPRQQVAYAATLLQEAAADWWVALLRERSGRRPENFAEFTVLLCKRFGSSTRVDRARAELRNICQGQSETVRSYSTRFESLLGKLPTHDREWAKVQFIWGLHQRIAELVTIAALHAPKWRFACRDKSS